MPVSGSMLVVDGVPAPLELRRTARARRLSLRVEPGNGRVRVVVPADISKAEAVRFVERHRDWLLARLAAVAPRQPFVNGAVIPILGVAHTLRHDAGHRGAPLRSEGPLGPELRIGGQPEFLARRVLDFLKAEARRQIACRVQAKAAQLGVRIAGIAIRDTKSRWGSCSPAGSLSFSWRLVLAPEPVLDYVVAHEVAHRIEMNHSPDFWALCARLVPDVTGPRAWLKANGARLHRYG